MMTVVRAAIRFVNPSYLGSGCKRMYPEPTRTRPAFADDGEKRKRETEETERLYGTVVTTTQLLVQTWGGARTHTAPLSWGRKECQNTS